MSDHEIRSVEALREIVPEPAPGIELKVYGELPEEARAFVARSPFTVIAVSTPALPMHELLSTVRT